MKAGELDRRLTWQRATSTTDNFGGRVVVWEDLFETWCKKDDAAGRRLVQALETTDEQAVVLVMRWRPGLHEIDRVLFEGKAWVITGLTEQGRRDGLEVKLTTRMDTPETNAPVPPSHGEAAGIAVVVAVPSSARGAGEADGIADGIAVPVAGAPGLAEGSAVIAGVASSPSSAAGAAAGAGQAVAVPVAGAAGSSAGVGAATAAASPARGAGASAGTSTAAAAMHVLFDWTGATPPSGGWTFTRASIGQVFGSTLALEQKAIDVARYRYDLTSGLSRGLLVESARTNSLRNNTMVGAVAGTPGTAPTNWAVTSTLNNVTREIVGTGTEDGINYIDIKYSGVPSATFNLSIGFEQSAQVVATPTDTWTASCYFRLVAGALANFSGFRFAVVERTAAGVANVSSFTAPAPTGAALKTQRVIHTRTFTDPTTARVTSNFQITCTNGQAVDGTFRFGLPQLELGEDASTPIKTSTVAVARSIDIAKIRHTPVFDIATFGTWVVKFRTPLAPPIAATIGSIILWDGTSANAISILYDIATGNIRALCSTSGGNSGSCTLGAPGADVEVRVAVRIETNNFGASLNGAAPVVDVTCDLPGAGVLNELFVGRYSATTRQIKSAVRSIEFIPGRASNAQLQALSA